MTRAPAHAHAPRPPGPGHPAAPARRLALRRGGFTLLELVLAMVLLALLAAAALGALAGWYDSDRLDEGVFRFETAIRMTRAQAANEGRSLQLAIDDQGRLILMHEPDPLGAPGVWEPYTAPLWLDSIPNAMVRVTSCRFVGESTYQALLAEQMSRGGSEGFETLAVMFYPDGSGDSVVFELAPADQSDDQAPDVRGVVEVDGVNGIVQGRVLMGQALEDFHARQDMP